MAFNDSDLRAILDRRGNAGKSKEERKYYESMMRRLGYTEAAMREATEAPLVEEPVPVVPEPVAAPKAKATVAAPSQSARLIELEYGGAEEIPSFEPVRPKVHPKAVEPEIDETEYEIAEAEPAHVEEDNEFILLMPDDEDDVVEFTEDFDDEELVEFQSADHDDPMEGVDALSSAPVGQDSWAGQAAPASPPVVAQTRSNGHQHGAFTLYRRELDGGQHVYFYSKKAPSDAEPADIPSGYGVEESEESGLPYLARAA